MNRVIHILINSSYVGYMGVAGGILGVNTGLYTSLKSGNDNVFFTAYAGLVGGTIGTSIGIIAPQVVPAYILSIPCYLGIKYLIKKELI